MTKNVLIFTDLDGTLLNFKTFDVAPILPFISKLKDAGIQIIPNSSKCHFEIKEIISKINLECPYITENGAAIYIPKNLFLKQPQGSTEQGKNWVLTLGIEKDIINQKIRQTSFKKYMKFILFLRNMTKLQKSYYTGLKPESLDRTDEREFSEPLIWMGSNTELDNFKKALNEEGLSIIHGARLLHLTGLNTKGEAMKILSDYYSEIDYFDNQEKNEIKVISCGGSKNDLSMLEISDYAVVIRLPDMRPIGLRRKNNVFNSRKIAPLGWQETLEEMDLIKEILKTN